MLIILNSFHLFNDNFQNEILLNPVAPRILDGRWYPTGTHLVITDPCHNFNLSLLVK